MADFGKNAKSLAKKGASQQFVGGTSSNAAHYNSDFDTSLGKKELDAGGRARQRLAQKYATSLKDLKCLYIWGAPGSGKSFISDLLYYSMDLENRKKR